MESVRNTRNVYKDVMSAARDNLGEILDASIDSKKEVALLSVPKTSRDV